MKKTIVGIPLPLHHTYHSFSLNSLPISFFGISLPSFVDRFDGSESQCQVLPG